MYKYLARHELGQVLPLRPQTGTWCGRQLQGKLVYAGSSTPSDVTSHCFFLQVISPAQQLHMLQSMQNHVPCSVKKTMQVQHLQIMSITRTVQDMLKCVLYSYCASWFEILVFVLLYNQHRHNTLTSSVKTYSKHESERKFLKALYTLRNEWCISNYPKDTDNLMKSSTVSIPQMSGYYESNVTDCLHLSYQLSVCHIFVLHIFLTFSIKHENKIY